MVYPSTEEIYKAFLNEDIHCELVEKEESSYINAGVSGTQTDYDILFISRSEDNDVALRVFRLIRFPDNRTEAMTEAAAVCTARYRYVKFVVDPEACELQVQFDFLQSTEDIGQAAVEMFFRTMQIIREACPELMRAAWG